MKVRLEAVVSCTWVDPSVAVQVLEIVNELPQDKNLKLGYRYALRALKPSLAKHPMMMPAKELAQLPVTGQVLNAIVSRPGLDRSLREKALQSYMRNQRTRSANLSSIIINTGKRGDGSLPDWIAMLNETDPKDIASSRDFIEGMLVRKVSEVRRAGYAAMLRGGLITSKPDQPDYFRSIVHLDNDALKKSMLEPATSVLGDSKSSMDLKSAALFALGSIPGCDEAIFGHLVSFVGERNLMASAAEALLTRGAKTWPGQAIGAQLARFVPALEKTPVTDRGSEGFKRASKLFTSFAKKSNKQEVAKRIAALQLHSAHIASIPDKLKFDRKTFTVTAGTPIELHFDNPDAIPHNVVICTPGSLEKVGLGVDALLSDPKAMAKDWIPDMPEVLFATPMAQVEEAVVTRFIAPTTPGRYPFLCTVPGHWRVMQGDMIVVDPKAKTAAVKKPQAKSERPSILILTGEPEYGSRVTLGAFGKKLREKHGMDVAHIHVVKKDKEHHFPGLEDALAKADVLLIYVRFLNLVKSDYLALEEYFSGPKSFIAVRTSTHPFDYPNGHDFVKEERAFPTRHFGTPYRGHHGHQTSQINYVMAARDPVMAGIDPRFWTPDFVYGTNPLAVHSTPLVVGQGLKGLQRAAFKERVSPGNHVYVLSKENEGRVIGSPHPVVWTVDGQDGRERSLVSTIGARKSFDDPNVQRLFLNAVYWALGKDTSSLGN